MFGNRFVLLFRFLTGLQDELDILSILLIPSEIIALA